MPATFGVVDDFGGTAPSGGYMQESSEEQSVEVATIKDASGKTVVAQPKGVVTTTVTIRSKGDVSIGSAPSIGSFSGFKVTAAKISESNDDFRTAEVTAVKYESL
jgi:glyoxylate utilization-related uncharacterized protein